MAYRFKVSKYKNAAPKIPKKEQCITEIPMGRIMGSQGNFVTCSAKHVAFNIDSGGGGCAGVLPLDFVGRRNKKVPTVYAHGEFLNDMSFSPFDDDLLATCSNDGTVKLWDIPENFEDIHDQPLSVIKPDETTRKLELLSFHPIADEVLACVAFDAIHYIDLNSGETQTCVENGSNSLFQSMSWRFDGTVMITSAKDCKNRVIDPRAGNVTTTFSGTQGNKDSRVCWLGNTDYIFGSGFDKQRQRIICVWDIRKPDVVLDEQEQGTGSGVLMPLHDIDTNMLILAGKGDSTLHLFEFREDIKSVTFSSTQMLSQQTFGIGMTPKRILNVMEGEVDRVYQLSKNMLMPLPYIVPRKSYRDFHTDLFPDTVYSGTAAMDAVEWFGGQNKEGIKLSLDPKIERSKPISSALKSKKSGKVECTKNNVETSPDVSSVQEQVETSTTQEPAETKPDSPNEEPKKKDGPKKKFIAKGGLKGLKKKKEQTEAQQKDEDNDKAGELPQPKKGGFKAAYQSKFKHLLGEVMHKSNNIENITNLSESLPSESDAFQGNRDFLIISLSGVGGRLNVLKLSKPGRLPESDYPVIQNGCAISDFALDPFDHTNLAVGCEDWHIRLWKIPEDGLTETLKEPVQILKGHQQRVTIVKYHPTASNVLVSASMDFTVRVWDLSDYSEIGALGGHTDQIFCLAWHPDGKFLATFCKDKKIRIYDPVEDVDVIKEMDGPEVLRGARMCWCGPNNNWIIISTASGKGRSLYLYDSESLDNIGKLEEIDNSPSVLSLYYDESTNVLFATGKGDRTVYTFEISEMEPKIHSLSLIKTSGLVQGINLMQKDLLDVRKIEFARLICLKKTGVDLVSVTVPRVKPEYFQDDIFPDVRVTWEASLTGEEWLDGNSADQKWISLKPSDMKKLSDAPKEAPKAAKYSSKDILSAKSDEEKKTELINAMVNKLDFDDKLEQDDFEGVDEDEWDD